MSERPVECSECKKPVTINFVEIVGDAITRTSMCSDCPAYHKHVHGLSQVPCANADTGAQTGVCCGNCGSTLSSIRMGHPLGCGECYAVFEDMILNEMVSSGKVSSKVKAAAGAASNVHIGRSPGEATEINPSLRLVALNEALKETLSREDYEQAAWIRDQINQIKGDSDGEQSE